MQSNFDLKIDEIDGLVNSDAKLIMFFLPLDLAIHIYGEITFQ